MIGHPESADQVDGMGVSLDLTERNRGSSSLHARSHMLSHPGADLNWPTSMNSSGLGNGEFRQVREEDIESITMSLRSSGCWKPRHYIYSGTYKACSMRESSRRDCRRESFRLEICPCSQYDGHRSSVSLPSSASSAMIRTDNCSLAQLSELMRLLLRTYPHCFPIVPHRTHSLPSSLSLQLHTLVHNTTLHPLSNARESPSTTWPPISLFFLPFVPQAFLLHLLPRSFPSTTHHSAFPAPSIS